MQIFTRLDFDGVVSTAMLTTVERIHEVNFANPREVEEKEIDIDFGDAIVHLPFHPDARLWFHHHEVSGIHPSLLSPMRGKFGKARSTAHQVFDHYAPKLDKFENLVKEVDRIENADLVEDDVHSPKGWILLSYTLDPRFIKEHEYGAMLIEKIREGFNVTDILALAPVKKRVDRYFNDQAKYLKDIPGYTTMKGKVILTDFREIEDMPHGNRFSVFTEYPQGNVHIRLENLGPLRVKLSASKSIFNRTFKGHIGKLMEEFGGGGIEGAGTCILGKKTADKRVEQIIEKLNG